MAWEPSLDRPWPVPHSAATASRRFRAGTHLRRALRLVTPAQSLLLGFTCLTVAGALLLTLPASSALHDRTPFVDALFMATSAVTTTGLGVVDTGSHFSLLGQLVLLLLFQIGGLGYMVFIAFLAYFLRRKLSIRTRLSLTESLNGAPLGELRSYVRHVLIVTLIVEVVGAVILAMVWGRQLPPGRALYFGIFHSVSAFCTAGFGLLPDSFCSLRDSSLANVTIGAVTIAGGIGFFVIYDLTRYVASILRGRRPLRLSVHTKLTVTVSAIVAVAGSAFLLFSESSFRTLPVLPRVFAATFQALSASTTTGFNSVDIGALSSAGLFVLILLMFVGASPGGTGGGIKTTTLGALLASVSALLKGETETVAFKQRLSPDVVYRALTVVTLGTLVVTGATLALSLTEHAAFLQVLFEAVSAFATVGLSTGITPTLSTAGKFIVSLTMLIGRLGPLAVGFALVGANRSPRVRRVDGIAYVG